MMAQEIKVIEAMSVKEFTKAVNDSLTGEWKLHGGMSVVSNTNTHQTFFYQTLVREYEQPGAWG
jgi:hypothetical protein